MKADYGKRVTSILQILENEGYEEREAVIIFCIGLMAMCPTVDDAVRYLKMADEILILENNSDEI